MDGTRELRLDIAAPGSKDWAAKHMHTQHPTGSFRGLVNYVAKSLFGPGQWAGLELAMVTGKNNGSLKGQ